jgi:hypothetical protein
MTDFGDVLTAYFQGWRDGFGQALDDVEGVLDKDKARGSEQ